MYGIYRTESLCCTPETNNIVSQLYANNFFFKRKLSLGIICLLNDFPLGQYYLYLLPSKMFPVLFNFLFQEIKYKPK